jgi:carbamoyltransferase
VAQPARTNPAVCRPEEALDCFLRTKMDALVIGEVVMLRR